MNDLIELRQAFTAWNTEAFTATLKKEIEALGAVCLPLEGSLNTFGAVGDDISVMVLGVEDNGATIEARITVQCTVAETQYCCPIGAVEQCSPHHVEMTVRIDKKTASTDFQLISREWSDTQ